MLGAVLYAAGILVCLLLFAVYKCVIMKRGQKRDGVSYVVQKTKNLFMKFVSGVTLRSKVLVIAVFCCNLLFVGIAVYRTYLPVYTCFEFNAATILEMIVSILLIVFFFIRLFASKNIFYFWFDERQETQRQLTR